MSLELAVYACAKAAEAALDPLSLARLTRGGVPAALLNLGLLLSPAALYALLSSAPRPVAADAEPASCSPEGESRCNWQAKRLELSYYLSLESAPPPALSLQRIPRRQGIPPRQRRRCTPPCG